MQILPLHCRSPVLRHSGFCSAVGQLECHEMSHSLIIFPPVRYVTICTSCYTSVELIKGPVSMPTVYRLVGRSVS